MGTNPSARTRQLGLAQPLIVAVVGMLFLAACSTAGSSAGSSAAAGETVNVTLQEFSVLLDKDEVAAGSVTFDTTNVGPDDVHEFVVLKTDLEPGDLPVDADGAVDEGGADIEVIGEIEDIAVDASDSLTLDLAAGNYVLICNIFDADENEAHYHEGMRVAFTVT